MTKFSAARNAGIEKNVTPNMLRHTFITHLFMAGADAEAVRQLAGHKSLYNNMIYPQYRRPSESHSRETSKSCAKIAPMKKE